MFRSTPKITEEELTRRELEALAKCIDATKNLGWGPTMRIASYLLDRARETASLS